MYNQIDSNKRKTWLLIIGFIVLVGFFAWLIGQVYNASWFLPAALLFALGQAWVSYYYADSIALAASGAVLLPDEGQGKLIHNAVENAAITAGLPKPRVYFIDDASPNAFATGRDPQHAAVAVTRGLIEKLDKRELEGVLAHEMSHVGNYDIRVMSLVVVLVGVIVLLSEWFRRAMWFGGGRRNQNDQGNILGIIAIVFAILSPLIATLIQLAVSRKREFLADATGALITRDPQGLADALKAIGGDRLPLSHANNATAHLFIANPFKADVVRGGTGSWFANLFNTHPPIAERIKRLEAMEDAR